MKVKDHWITLKGAASKSLSDKVLKLSAALAYYTVFSLPPLLLVVTAVANLVLKDSNVEGKLFSELRVMIGYEATTTLEHTLEKTEILGNTVFATIAGIITLLIGASGVFAELQDSLNTIFGVRPNPKKGLIPIIVGRLTSFGMMLSLGFLLMVSLVITTLLTALIERLKAMFPDITVYLAMVLDLLLSFGLFVLLFGAIFKVLPDIRIGWRDVFRGAVFTALLFMLGKIAIGVYLGQSSLSTAYGAAGSIIILLVWVYYSSILLYFGAEYTQLSAVKYGKGIRPNEFSEWVRSSDDKVSERSS